MREKILALMETNSRLSASQIAVMLGIEEGLVLDQIKTLEEERAILGYHTLVDWEKTDRPLVTALIEVRVTPQRGLGFDKIAERIYQYPEVDSVFLISGGYDLSVVIEGKTMKEVALFVAQKLAPMDSILSCATHFVLKKYKKNGMIFQEPEKDQRAAIWL